MNYLHMQVMIVFVSHWQSYALWDLIFVWKKRVAAECFSQTRARPHFKKQ
jgi:hypothetical protein